MSLQALYNAVNNSESVKLLARQALRQAKNGNNFVVELVNGGKCLAVGEGKTLKTANKHAVKKACLNFMK